MKQKFFFFDIDNTLAVWPDGCIPDSTMDTLRRLEKAGHRVALATGRLQADAKRFAIMAELGDFVADGGRSMTAENEIVYMEGMDREMCLAYLAQLDAKGLHWAVTDTNELRRVTPYEDVLNWHPSWDVFTTVHQADYDYRRTEQFIKSMRS